MKRRLRISVIFALITAILSMSAICVSAEGTTIKVESITAEAGESVDVPIMLSGNTGICGATMSFAYDSKLTLTEITRGSALSLLKMTEPKDLSANPISIPWYDIDALDTSNGTLVILKFTAPEEAGTYNIDVIIEDGDIIDNDLNAVDVATVSGQIKVLSGESNKLYAENIGMFTSDKAYTGTAVKATAFKADLGTITGTLSFIVTPKNGEAKVFDDSAYITDANIVLGIIVSGLADENAICEITVK